jgi:hypothetical protein
MSDGSLDELPLPPLQIAMLDAVTVERLFFDVAHAATLLEVVVKAGGAVHVEEPPEHDDPRTSLSSAKTALLEGAVLGVQLRYRLEEREWWDTILAQGSAFRLVRIEQRR